ncbi:gliding motility-associated C-terminal domain-containing protein [Niastella caeni]|uniref:Gliding motility-associated C-terminal domain-containing protein n=1 Tax=Niastella caeni TaxID=2569763 RepID=A0A4V4H008_9BACT|nr:gliding motility-associated C-terminal domain-containing protein [Niastella caeni]THU34766.1 gliding motility-associated C-terminal domain-containing protein [Niastella caeni]
MKGNFTSFVLVLLCLFQKATSQIVNRESSIGSATNSGSSNNISQFELKNHKPQTSNHNPVKALQAETCPTNIDFESGSFNNWRCYIGETDVQNNKNVINVTASSPVTGRHTLLVKAAGATLDPYGGFPINPPDGSGYAVKLGNDDINKEAERIVYEFTVPANAKDASITYRYAVVFEDPGHVANEQPRFIARMLDVQSNTYLPCASNEYIATASLPGFQTSPVDGTVKFKPWSSAFLNLDAYAGKTLQLEFTTADCTQGGHWGYAYVDVGECNVSAIAHFECNPMVATFTGPAGFQEYKWFDDNFTKELGTGEVLVIDPAPPINNVNVVVVPFNGFGCSDTLQASVYPILPLANAGPDTVVCPDHPITIGSPAASGFTYAWSPANFLSDSLVAQPVGRPPQPATYVVTVTSIESGCIDKDTINLTVFQPIEITVSPDQTICEGQMVNLQAQGAAVTYAWSPGQGLSRSNIANPVAAPKTTTNYQVIGFDGHQCFTDTGFIKVIVNPKPQVDVGPDVALATGSTHTFAPKTQNGPIVSWQWSPGADLSCTSCSTPVATVKKNTTYYARVTNENGCVGVDSMNIRPFCLSTQVFIPNAFSPDGDGMNDVFMVRGKGVALVRSFRVFSRWGELVFEKTNFSPNDPAFGWDGRIRGATGPAEVYVYIAEVVCENDLINTYKGNVTLLK